MCPLGAKGRPDSVRDRDLLDRKEPLVAASEFQRTLMSHLSRQGVSVAALARQTGYSPVLLENLIAGKSRQMPVDFFVRVADALDLTIEEKEDLVRSWAFGIEKRTWHLPNSA
jgi:lambda repressor-like predicted transcriptional regulator